MPGIDAMGVANPHSREFERLFERTPTPSDAALAAEVAALRATVQRLVDALEPPSTVIATGRDVLAEYARLRR